MTVSILDINRHGLLRRDDIGTGPNQAAPGPLLAALASAPGYKGAWDASGGVMPADPAVGNMWLCSTGGTVGGVAYLAGDLILYTGTAWLRRPYAFPGVYPGAALSLNNGLTGGSAATIAWDAVTACWLTSEGVSRALHADYDTNGHDLTQLFDGNGETFASYADKLVDGSGRAFEWNDAAGCWDTGAYGVDYAVQALTANSALTCGSADAAFSLDNYGTTFYFNPENNRWATNGAGVENALQADFAVRLDNLFGNTLGWNYDFTRWEISGDTYTSGTIALASAGVFVLQMDGGAIALTPNGVENTFTSLTLLDINGASLRTKGFDESIQQAVADTATLSQVIAALKTAGLFIDPV